MKNLLLSTLLLAISGLHAFAGTVSLVPSSDDPHAGETFTVDLVVTGNTDEILGFGLDYTVSDPAIGLQGITINPFFGDDLGLGDPEVSAITFPGATDSTVTLATFSFSANSEGSSQFSVISDLSDPNEGLFGLNAGTSDLSQQLTINVQAATPEPGTLSFAALGAAGLLLALIFRPKAAL